MTCQKCGRPSEPDGTPTHYIGCRALRGPEPAPPAASTSTPEPCEREGCMNPRAISKGPRPAKYCEQHKTKRSK